VLSCIEVAQQGQFLGCPFRCSWQGLHSQGARPYQDPSPSDFGSTSYYFGHVSTSCPLCHLHRRLHRCYSWYPPSRRDYSRLTRRNPRNPDSSYTSRTANSAWCLLWVFSLSRQTPASIQSTCTWLALRMRKPPLLLLLTNPVVVGTTALTVPRRDLTLPKLVRIPQSRHHYAFTNPVLSNISLPARPSSNFLDNKCVFPNERTVALCGCDDDVCRIRIPCS
jgi:hypothetical protein